MTTFMNNLYRSARALSLALLLGTAPMAFADNNPQLSVRHLASEQNLVAVQGAAKYLLLPVQDNAPEAKVYLIGSDNHYLNEGVNVRLARERVDYYVPLDLSVAAGGNVTVEVQGLPSGALCWKKMKLSDTFDTPNREKFRPFYHHTPA